MLAAALVCAAGSSACGRGGLTVYPHPAGEPGEEPPPEITGVTCSGRSGSCEDVKQGSGDPLQPYALVTVRLTVDDLIEPPVRIGPRQLSFLHPPLGTVEFMGRQRDLTINMFGDTASEKIGAAFFEQKTDALVGVWLVGMRRGGSRRVQGRYTGTLEHVELPPGRERAMLIELLDFCYPTVRVSSGVRWSMFAGSSGPAELTPRLSVAGCGAA